nr:glycosyltransferase WbuB [Bradyrhizobium sp. CCBAU 45384]
MLTVTAPFVLPYAVAAAARLKGARAALTMHDLFPDVLVMTGLLQPGSLMTRTMRAANGLMFRALNAVITIGRDAQRPLLSYAGMTRSKIRFIPNWATLVPAPRPATPDNPFRKAIAARALHLRPVGQSRLHPRPRHRVRGVALSDGGDGHSVPAVGLGHGLRAPQAIAGGREPTSPLSGGSRIPSLKRSGVRPSLDHSVPEGRCESVVPSRLDKLLAVGRPVVLVSEPEAEAALTVVENGLGWVMTPGRANQLADAIRAASRADDGAMAGRAVKAAAKFDQTVAMNAYAGLIGELLRSPDLSEQR